MVQRGKFQGEKELTGDHENKNSSKHCTRAYYVFTLSIIFPSRIHDLPMHEFLTIPRGSLSKHNFTEVV